MVEKNIHLIRGELFTYECVHCACIILFTERFGKIIVIVKNSHVSEEYKKER